MYIFYASQFVIKKSIDLKKSKIIIQAQKVFNTGSGATTVVSRLLVLKLLMSFMLSPLLTDLPCASLCITDMRCNHCTRCTETTQHRRLKGWWNCRRYWTWHSYLLCTQSASVHELVVLFAPFSFVACCILSRWPTLHFTVKHCSHMHTHAHKQTHKQTTPDWMLHNRKTANEMFIQVSLCPTTSINSVFIPEI